MRANTKTARKMIANWDESPEGLKVRKIRNFDGTLSWSVSIDGIWKMTVDADTVEDALRIFQETTVRIASTTSLREHAPGELSRSPGRLSGKILKKSS